ncbi:MAG: hypothetical protein LBF15_01270 [Candidatus Peribacteria bacterium]|nr:hypothetical protein [Candidatus Peribacteria bacterium]
MFEAIVFLGVLFWQNIEITNLIIWSIINIFFKLEITLGIVFFLSTFMSNILTIATTLLVYILAHSYSVILDLVYSSENTILIYLTKF